ncbi:MAG: methyltransferase, partial [Bdellovibrionales bacterium]
EAMTADNKLLVVESVIPMGNEPFHGKFLDLVMLLIPGGKERTVEEYGTLFGKADFELIRVIPTPTEISILEVRKK